MGTSPEGGLPSRTMGKNRGSDEYTHLWYTLQNAETSRLEKRVGLLWLLIGLITLQDVVRAPYNKSAISLPHLDRVRLVKSQTN